MNLWEDARVVRGMRAQLELRRKRLAAGDAPLGWKVGFAAPAMLKRLDITGPLVGFLTRAARVQSGGSVSFAGWVKPVAEPEIAVHIGRDVSAGADHETAKAAIAGISPAIEIVDLTAPPEDPERILSGNIYHATWCWMAPERRAPAARPTASLAASFGVEASSRAPAIRKPIPGTGSASCATLPTCSRPSASNCAAEKSSSPGRWCCRSRSSRARMPSPSRSTQSRASRFAFPGEFETSPPLRPLVQNVLAAGLMLTVWTSLARGETSGQTSAQAWPQRTVRFIIPLPPGSGTDLAARLLAERLTARWGQPVVVENRQGADGI